MAKKDSVLRLVILVVLTAHARLGGAQVIETPIAFDSAGKVRSLTPALATRFALEPAVWPVRGDFVEARLYVSADVGHVLVVERANGDVYRYPLALVELSALRNAIDSAMTSRIGGVVAEPATEREDVSRGAFLRNQMILSAAVYGPLIAALANDGKTGTALYLLSTGASFFVVNNISKNTHVTRVQNDMSTDGTLRGFAVAAGLLHSFGGDDISRQTYSAVGLAGAVAGSVGGFMYGRRLTDSEAQSARTSSTLAAAAAFGALGAAGVFESTDSDRGIPPPLIAAGALGYLLGPMYPRRAAYTVTAGDVRLIPLGAAIGLGAGIAPVTRGDQTTRALWISGTAGLLAGSLLADRAWVRPYDHTNGDATLVWLGGIAGALMGGAAAILASPVEEGAVIGFLTAGTLLGSIGGHAIAKPRPASPARKRY
jgi:hypothetical protein